MNKAIKDGYCAKHMEGELPEGYVEEDVDREMTQHLQDGSSSVVHKHLQESESPWPTILVVAACIFIIYGVLEGIGQLYILNRVDFPSDSVTTSAKFDAFLAPIFVKGAVALVLCALSQIIKLLEKLSKK